MKLKSSFLSLLGAAAALWSAAPGVQAQTAPTNAQLLDRLLATAKPGDDHVKCDDMLLEIDKVRAVRGQTGAGRSASSAFYRTTLWPGGNVPYVFDASLLPAQREFFLQAAREWESVARLKFTVRTNQADYIRVLRDPSEGSFSFIGKIGGEQEMSLANWATKYTAAHEIAHALGVMHEQSRSNRDTFVSIDFSNVTPGTEINFAIVENSNNRGDYDFGSVMHYPKEAFAIDFSKPTIITKPDYAQFQNSMGQRTRLSPADKQGMIEIYGLPLTDQPPANDNFAKAQLIEGTSGTVDGTNKLATREDGEVANATASVWYRWKPVSKGTMTLTTKGSNLDTTLGVYLGTSVSTVTPVAFNDDVTMGATSPATGLTSSVTFEAQAGATYYIAVDSYFDLLRAGSTGPFKLNYNQKMDTSTRYKISGSVKTSAGAGVGGVLINLTGADATNSATSATATSEPSGVFTILNMPGGTYDLRASKTGFNFSPSSIRIALSAESKGNNFIATPTPIGDLPEMYVSDVTVREGKSGGAFLTFNVSLSFASKTEVTALYTTLNGSASSATDYKETKGSLKFAPGTTTIAVNVGVRPDVLVEGDENFFLRIRDAVGARITDEQGTATLLNDDRAASNDPSARGS